ncbi:hypothetical protein U1Q18_040869 [Sarracenia purpurea var. burkii]
MFCYSYILLLLLCAMPWLLNWVAAAMAFASMALAAGLLFYGSLQILQIVGAITILQFLQMQIFHGSLQILLPWFCWNWANGEVLLFCSL